MVNYLLFLLLLGSPFFYLPSAQSSPQKLTRDLNTKKETNASTIFLGILRQDGILTPIGKYEESTWKDFNIFGLPTRNKSSKETISFLPLKNLGVLQEQVPKPIPSNWFFWKDPLTLQTIELSGAVQHESHCEIGWGLQSNFLGETPNYWPQPKTGIATNFPKKLTIFQMVNQDSLVKQGILKILINLWEKQEEQELSQIIKQCPPKDPHRWFSGHPLSKKERQAASIEISNIFKVAHKNPIYDLWYLEGIRKYLKPKGWHDENCWGLTKFTTWISNKNGDPNFSEVTSMVSDCDGKGITTIKPHASLILDDTQYIVAESYGYEAEEYTIHKVENGNLIQVFSVGGGGC